MDENQDDERATAFIAIWHKKTEDLFGRRSHIVHCKKLSRVVAAAGPMHFLDASVTLSLVREK